MTRIVEVAGGRYRTTVDLDLVTAVTEGLSGSDFQPVTTVVVHLMGGGTVAYVPDDGLSYEELVAQWSAEPQGQGLEFNELGRRLTDREKKAAFG